MKLQRDPAAHGLPIEAKFGYVGALRVGHSIHIAGQLARDAAGVQVAGPLATKLSIAYDNIAALLARFGLTLESVLQTQVHVDIPLLENLETIRTVSRQRLRLPDVSITVIQVAGLNDPDGMVEISAVARADSTPQSQLSRGTNPMKPYTLPNSFAARLGGADVVEHRDILYVSGQLPVDDQGRLMCPGDIAGQFGSALDRVDKALRSVNSSLSRVLALDIFTSAPLTPDRFDAFCEAHRKRMTEYHPTGTMVRVYQLPLEGALVYISAIAAR